MWVKTGYYFPTLTLSLGYKKEYSLSNGELNEKRRNVSWTGRRQNKIIVVTHFTKENRNSNLTLSVFLQRWQLIQGLQKK